MPSERSSSSLAQLNQTLTAFRPVLNSLQDRVALIDENGIIRLYNEPWIHFYADGSGNPATFGIGWPFFQCWAALYGTHDIVTLTMQQALKAMLKGESERLTVRHPTPSSLPGQEDRALCETTLRRLTLHNQGVVLISVRRLGADEILVPHSEALDMRFETMFRESLDALLLVDSRTGLVRKANHALTRTLGYTPDAIVGKPFAQLFPGFEPIRNRDWLHQLVVHDTVFEMQEFTTARGTPLMMDLTAAVIPWENEHIILVTLRDVSARHRAQQALKQANDMLEHQVAARTQELRMINQDLMHALETKDTFLANTSHELRTPLNAILGISESLLEEVYGSLTSKQSVLVQTIETSGRHLLALINDILDLAKINSGRLDIELDYVSVYDICQSSLQMVRQSAYKKRLTISETINSNVPQVWADGRRLKQILVNLLSNAVKFTPENGQIGLEVHTDAAEETLFFTVWDTGIGIATEDMARLFDPFVQLEEGLARSHEGTGLGLTLVMQLVDLHGGSVQVESEVGQGSRFTVSLSRLVATEPSVPTPLPGAPMPEHPAPSPPVTEALILLAEDNQTSAEMVQNYLVRIGYMCVVASNGPEALEMAIQMKPALILMDIQMPGMDGLEVMRHLRANPTTAELPIIALTALAMPGDRQQCMEAGADEYLSKPVSLRQLRQMIAHLLTRTPG